MFGIPAWRVVAYTSDGAILCTCCPPPDADDSAIFSSDCDTTTVEICGNCEAVICMVCGESNEVSVNGRNIGDECWNCGTEWRD